MARQFKNVFGSIDNNYLEAVRRSDPDDPMYRPPYAWKGQGAQVKRIDDVNNGAGFIDLVHTRANGWEWSYSDIEDARPLESDEEGVYFRDGSWTVYRRIREAEPANTDEKFEPYNRDDMRKLLERFPLHNRNYWEPGDPDYRRPGGNEWRMRKEIAEQLAAPPIEEDEDDGIVLNY